VKMSSGTRVRHVEDRHADHLAEHLQNASTAEGAECRLTSSGFFPFLMEEARQLRGQVVRPRAR